MPRGKGGLLGRTFTMQGQPIIIEQLENSSSDCEVPGLHKAFMNVLLHLYEMTKSDLQVPSNRRAGIWLCNSLPGTRVETFETSVGNLSLSLSLSPSFTLCVSDKHRCWKAIVWYNPLCSLFHLFVLTVELTMGRI